MSLGLEDVNGNGETDPTRFTYVDGTQDQSFYQEARVFPWGSNQPNNADNGDQDCVVYVKLDFGLKQLNFA